MDTPDDAAPGHGAVRLGDLQAMPKVGLELGVTKPFEEAAPAVAEDTRREDPGAVDVECVHPETVDGAEPVSLLSHIL